MDNRKPPARIAWVSNETPALDGSGGQRRQFHQIRTLLEAGCEVNVLALASDQDDITIRALTSVRRWSERRWQRHLRRGSRELEAAIRAVEPDAVVVAHIESFITANRVLKRVRLPVAVDLHNVNSRWFDMVGDEPRAQAWREHERQVMLRASLVTCCSREEAAALRAVHAGAKIAVAPHGVAPTEWPESSLGSDRARELAIFATWSHQPNRLALDWFLTEVWPAVVGAEPDTRLLLAGPGEPPLPAECRSHIEVLGRVEDLAHLLGACMIVPIPIVQGMGARVKLGEALASGAAVISTALGAEGIPADAPYLLADSPDAFAGRCITLLRDPAQATALGLRGRAWALENLTWRRTTEPLCSWCVQMRSS